MAFEHDSPATRGTASTTVDASKVLVVAILLLALAATLGLRPVISLDALAPSVASMLFGLAVIAGLTGLWLRRYAAHGRMIDLAGALTFVGIVVSSWIEPEQMLRLMALPEQPD